MRSGIESIIITRSIDNGESISDKPPSISRGHTIEICNELFTHQTSDAFLRLAVLGSPWGSSGRSSDIQAATLNLYERDFVLDIVGYTFSQRKTSKTKPACFVFDKKYVLNHFVYMGALLMTGNGQRSYKENSAANHWTFPELTDVNDASTKVSGYLQDLLPTSKSVGYKNRNLQRLPEEISAGSIR